MRVRLVSCSRSFVRGETRRAEANRDARCPIEIKRLNYLAARKHRRNFVAFCSFDSALASLNGSASIDWAGRIRARSPKRAPEDVDPRSDFVRSDERALRRPSTLALSIPPVLSSQHLITSRSIRFIEPGFVEFDSIDGIAPDSINADNRSPGM